MVNLIKLAPSAGFEIFKTLSPRPAYLTALGSAGSLGAAMVALDDSSGEAGELGAAWCPLAHTRCDADKRG